MRLGALFVGTACDGRNMRVGRRRVVPAISGVVVLPFSVRLLQTQSYRDFRDELEL